MAPWPGDSSQLGLVKCMEEEERYWLEVTELSDCMVSIQSPQVGQLVTFVLQTRVAGQGEQQAPVRGLLP